MTGAVSGVADKSISVWSAVSARGGGGGGSRYIKKVGMLVENFEIDP